MADPAIPQTLEELRLLIDTTQGQLIAAMTAIAEARGSMPTLRLLVKTMQRMHPSEGARAEVVLAMCDIIDLAAAKFVALGELAEQHGLVAL